MKKDIKLLEDYLMVNDINELNEQGRSGLDAAVSNDFPDGIKYLLDKGIDTTTKNKKGDTALQIAVKLGMKNVVEAILHKDLSTLNTRDADGNNVLWNALFNARLKPDIYFPIVEVLLKLGSDSSNKNNSGYDVSRVLEITTGAINERILELNSKYKFINI
ncbi:ankyrin repeat domain-containing protein [Flavobacterium cerinum]|uniref:Ankyrin repeat domain-containing protein n=1 Tax=Flavobacterium cerinum TaxID=2502784 RepID=A0A444GL93_9FLAO|nr:ankyrin repeat domain-containing protein [Flavobacterium cerinum]RWW91788.1 ankyrin repeat domain-containing protein [Flavobacterium cerinum]